jgi:tetratricopeptide (TPR) repeat protein
MENGEQENLRQRHLKYFAKLAKWAEPELYRSNQAYWLNILDEERENLRTAMEYSIRNNNDVSLKIAVGLWQFWEPHGYSSKLKDWLSHLLERYTSTNLLRIRAMVIYSQLIAQDGDLLKARQIAEQSLKLSQSIFDKYAEAFSLEVLGMIIALQGDLKGAVPIIKQSLSLYKTLDDKIGQAKVKGWLWLNNKAYEQSKTHIKESLDLYRELGHLSGIALCLSELAHRTIWEGEYNLPGPWLEEALMIYHDIGDLSGEAEIQYYFGNLAYWTGDYQKACEHYEDAIKLLVRVGIHLYSYWPRVDLAYALLRQGNIEEAIETFSLCIKGFQKAGNKIGIVYALEGMASFFTNKGQIKKALRLFAWSNVMREKMNDPRPFVEHFSVEKDLQIIKTEISDIDLASLQTEGQMMSMEQAIELALSEIV